MPNASSRKPTAFRHHSENTMPFSSSDATKHTKRASTAKLRRQWANVANSALKSGDSEGSAIRQANSVVRHAKRPVSS